MGDHHLFCLLHCYTHKLRCYILLIKMFYFNNHFLKHIHPGFAAITENQVSLFFVLEWKFCLWFKCFDFFGQHKVVVWVLLTIIYIVSHLVFKTSNLKPTTGWHWNSCCWIYINRILSFFVKQSECDLVHTSITCFILFQFLNYRTQNALSWFQDSE